MSPKATVVVSWDEGDDESVRRRLVEAACDSLMDRLVKAGVKDPAIELSLADSAEQAERIAQQGKALDYEQEALDAVQRSWELSDKGCQALALADAQVWATLHLARVTQAKGPTVQ